MLHFFNGIGLLQELRGLGLHNNELQLAELLWT
jgi:hypothetical protein